MPATQPPPGFAPPRRSPATLGGPERIFAALDSVGPTLPLTALEGALGALLACRGAAEELVRSATFSRGHYVRRLIHSGVGYEALLLSWLPGQRSAIHDHGGSVGAVCVLAGRLAEVDYVLDVDGLAAPASRRTYDVGSIAGAEVDDLHVIGNAETDVRLVTLHLYAPKLANMRTFGERASVVADA
jgi:hypothetical protein